MQAASPARYERARALTSRFWRGATHFVSALLPPRRRSARNLRWLVCVPALFATVTHAELPPAPVPLPRPPKGASPGATGPGVRVLVTLIRWQGGDAAYLRPGVQDAMWRDVAQFWQ